MKKIKSLISIIVAVMLLLSIVPITVSAAASVGVSGGSYNVGETVKVYVNFNAGKAIYTANLTVKYNKSVLKLKSVSGADYNTSGSTITILDDKLSDANKKVSKGSYTLTFSAIAAGSSTMAVSAYGVDESLSKISASTSATIRVSTPVPSSNANLSSLKVSGARLSPAFSAGTTEYTATVRYSVDKVTLSASKAHSDANLVGAGSFNLDVGKNTKTITVTAASGAKKSYTVTITRLSEEETNALIAEERDNDPLLAIIDGVDYKIKEDLSELVLPVGFELSSETRKDKEISAIKDSLSKYTLYYLTDAEGENGDYYTRNENDEFSKLKYLNIDGKLYIFEDIAADFVVPEGYVETIYTMGDEEVKAYKSENMLLSDFYFFNCYFGGETDFYRFDSVEGTIQRAPDFAKEAVYADAPAEEEEKKLPISEGKIILLLVIVAAAAIIALAVLLIVKISKSSRDADDFDLEEQQSELDFDFVDEIDSSVTSTDKNDDF